jgi:DNA-binding CsgD family transcriptional regulator
LIIVDSAIYGGYAQYCVQISGRLRGETVEHLSSHEYEAMLQITESALRAERAEDWWVTVSEAVLGPLFHADVSSVAQVDHRDLTGRFGLVRPEWAELAVPTGSPMHRSLVAEHPLSHHLFRPGGDRVARISDLISASAWQNMAGHATMRELIGATHQMIIPIVVAEVGLSLSPIRADSDFTDHEAAVARRLQPLLAAAYSHIQNAIRHSERMTPQQRAVGAEVATDVKLTPRERVILNFMADGLSTTPIGRILRISSRTVSKHQEKIYRKLRVTDRLAAVLTAQRLGLLPAPTHRG